MDYHRIEWVNRDQPPVSVRGDRPILTQIESAGIRLPFGCRRGVCLTCAARLQSGRVWHPRGVALRERDRDLGYVLLCVAEAQTDCRLEVGAASQSGLYSNPFKTGTVADR